MPESDPIRPRWPPSAALAALTICLAAAATHAGLGAENVAVVVNADSMASMAVANEFVHLRRIPASNVVYLSLGQPEDAESIDVKGFRTRILRPVLRTLAQRGLAGQIDCVAYSSDIPYAVRVAADVRDLELPRVATRTASINGLTYLYQFALAAHPAYLAMDANFYARRPLTRREADIQRKRVGPAGRIGPTRGFRSIYAWGSDGKRVKTGEGPRYLLSIMLAVTSGRGNTVDEALACLRRSAAADGTRPKGTVYYMVNDDDRTRTRQWGYAAAVDCLRAVGIDAELLPGIVPIARKDIAGLMTGTATFDWSWSGNRIRPGAVCEHLTSTGGVMRRRGGQTPLTEFLRHGAAGASGTVSEPYAIAAKFPSPFLHYHYARGCTLVEAFYQSIRAPYQLLIVGDPLCRPWAIIPTVTLDGLRPNQNVSGDLDLTAGVGVDPPVTVDGFEIFLDGRRIGICGNDGRFVLETQSLVAGHHELRVAAITGGDLETRGVLIVPFRLGPATVAFETRAASAEPVVLGDPLEVDAALAGAERIDLHHNGRLLASIDGVRGQVSIDTHRLGPGPVMILPIGRIETEGRPARVVRGQPIEVRIALPPVAAPTTEPAGDGRAGNETSLVPDETSDR